MTVTNLKEANSDGHEWVRLLAEQERQSANTTADRIWTLYNENKDDLCPRSIIGRSQPCGGSTVIRSKAIEKSLSTHERLFIGCSNYQHREKGHLFRHLDGYDPIEVLKIWGRDRCYVHKDILDSLGFSWDEYGDSDEGNCIFFYTTKVGIVKGSGSSVPVCYTVLANNQGSKDGKCSHYHRIVGDGGSITHRKGQIVQLSCNVKFHIFTPTFSNETPSTRYMAILSYGTHNHPPPPAHRIPIQVKEKILKVIQAFGVGEATARKLIASPILPIMLNGKTNLGSEHVALTNQDVVNYLIRKERAKEYPWGTDYQGVQYLMLQQNPDNPYIRHVELFPDGRFIILCQSPQQSRLLMHSTEIHADKTFSRTKCREFEINSYDPVSRRIVTLARVYMDQEDEWSYYKAFKSVFDQAEKDLGYRIPFGHLTADDKASPTGTRVKAILLDEHNGQLKGLNRYFQSKYPNDDKFFHVLRIVKVCQIHFKRTIVNLNKSDQTPAHLGIHPFASFLIQH